jgi:curved DNA-binding protein CbpA
MKKTLYDVLQVSEKASLENIEAAYQALKVKFKNAVDHESQNEFKLVQQAYIVLSDQKQRDKYDQGLKLQIAQNNAPVYYSDEPAGSSWTTKFILLIAIATTGYFAYQHFNKPNTNADSGNQDTPAQLDADKSAVSTTNPAVQAEAPVVSPTNEPAPPQPIASNNTEDWPPSGFAQINDVNAVPITAPQRKAYLSFLSHSNPRSFVICNDGRAITTFGDIDAIKKRLAALPAECKPYAVNDSVVWSGR